MWLRKLIIESIEFQRNIIRNNSGMSSKSYVMVKGMQLTRVIVIWYLIVLMIEMFTDYVLRSNWLDFVAVIGALSVFVLASAWGKVKGEQSYWNNNPTSEVNETKIDSDINKEIDAHQDEDEAVG